MSERTCEWRSDADEVWHTECGHAFVFTEGGPEENSAEFCQYCGGKLIAIKHEDVER